MFIPYRWLLLASSLISFALVGFAVHLQVNQGMLPCPWCVIIRYAFCALGLFALGGAIGSAFKPAAALGLLAALGGTGASGWLMYHQAHPSISCGIDPVETMLNKIFTAEWFPTLFMANGECTTQYPPVFGLSVPQGALVWMIVFDLLFLIILLRRRHN